MGKYKINLSKSAEKDLSKIEKSGRKQDIEKINQFFKEISENPREGIGKPEQLKYFKGEIWSREINKKDRFIYEIFEEEILIVVVQTKGHYNDK